jgi:phosphoribosyl-ATP pyrophosphohydrolase
MPKISKNGTGKTAPGKKPTVEKSADKKAAGKKPAGKKALAALSSDPVAPKPASRKKAAAKTVAVGKKSKPTIKKLIARRLMPAGLLRPLELGETGVSVLDRLYATIAGRKGADPSVSHSARLLSRGSAKVAQKFGEEAVECVIEAVAGNRDALIAESADVLYHLLVIWVDADIQAPEIWAELERRQGVSGIAEKAARAQKLSVAFGLGTSKIP